MRCLLLIQVALIAMAAAHDVRAQGGPPPTPVRVDSVRVEQLAPRRLATGDLRAPRRALVASREPGMVVDVPIVEGMRIARGEVIVRLDTTRRQIELDQLAADRAVAAAQETEYIAALAKLQQEAKRIRDSMQRGAGYPKELEDIEADIVVANARIESAKRAIEVIDVRKQLVEQRIEDMEVAAPFDGTILARHVEVGQWVGEGATVAEMIATDSIEAWVRVPQEHYTLLASGKHAIDIEIEATGGVRRADVYRVLPQVDDRGRSFTLIATLDNANHGLAPGMSALAWVPTGEPGERLTVPKSAVREGEVGAYLFVVRDAAEGAPATAVMTRVEVLFALPDRLAVRAPDLQAGDRVIVEGNERIFPGSPVRVVNTLEEDRKDGENADTSLAGGGA